MIWMGKYFAWSLLLIIAFSIFMPVMAHQPFFEDKEFSADSPKYIKDPSISTAVYATLETPTNVDYFTFNGSKGEIIFLSITIPQIEGQENFAPTMALLGPGLPLANLPDRIRKPQNYGALILPPPANATAFFEPFSRTSYWTRQEQNVTLPENSSYLVAVWDDKGEVGRYVFVIGNKEVPGGDLAFPLKMRNYWKPVVPVSQAQNQGYPAENGTNAPIDQQHPTPTDGRTQPGFAASFALIGLIAVAYLVQGRNLTGKK
jgi:PGF-CTERM protein